MTSDARGVGVYENRTVRSIHLLKYISLSLVYNQFNLETDGRHLPGGG